MDLQHDCTAFAWQDGQDRQIQSYKVTFQSDRCHLGDKLEQPRKGSVELLYVT